MKIGIGEIYKALHDVALNKLANSLERDGFDVDLDPGRNLGRGTPGFDLYATKGDEHRIYEIKIGKNKMQKKQFQALQEYARDMRAKLFITYLELPTSKEIEYDNIDSYILEYLQENVPDEIDALSTHTYIEDVDSVEITSLKICNDKQLIKGNASVNVLLQYGSDTDIRKNDGVAIEKSIDFYFRLDIRKDKIFKAYFKFDLDY